MFRGPSWIKRAGVTLLLLISLSVGSLALPHNDDADAGGSPILVAHDQSAHQIRAASTAAPAESEHCILCHSLRSYYPAFDKFEHHHSVPRTERLHIAPIDRARLTGWTLVPGRAPPV
jgi:hypothetical protein